MYLENDKSYYKINHRIYSENGLLWWNAVDNKDMEFIDRFRLKGLQIKQLEISTLKRRVHKTNYTQGAKLKSNMLEAIHMIIARRRNY